MSLIFGIDAVPLTRAAQLVQRYGAASFRRVATAAESEASGGSPEALAVLLAIKESGIKAIGGRPPGFRWHQIEVLPGHAPAPPARVADLMAAFCRDAALEATRVVGVAVEGAALAGAERLLTRPARSVKGAAAHGLREGHVLAVVAMWSDEHDSTEGTAS